MEWDLQLNVVRRTHFLGLADNIRLKRPQTSRMCSMSKQTHSCWEAGGWATSSLRKIRHFRFRSDRAPTCLLPGGRTPEVQLPTQSYSCIVETGK